MPAQLLPCPFCDSEDIQILPQGGGWRLVRCTTCGASKSGLTESDAVIANSWNLRNGRVAPEAFNDSCEEA